MEWISPRTLLEMLPPACPPRTPELPGADESPGGRGGRLPGPGRLSCQALGASVGKGARCPP